MTIADVIERQRAMEHLARHEMTVEEERVWKERIELTKSAKGKRTEQ
jgi:hypothetical protein